MTLGRVAWVIGRLITVLAALVVLCRSTAVTAADPERRIALVIGIGAYQSAPHLANPVNDARAIGDSLRRLRFDVTELDDPDFRELSSGVRAFGIRAASADVVVVYYAGHGVQVDRENYLIPADAKLERERDLLYEAMPVDRLLGEVAQAARIGIVLLDSCRNNPFVDRVARSLTIAGRTMAATPGLARVDNVPRNTMVVMAAKADQIAEDGNEHSPFAAALLSHFQIPGLELSLFFRSVRDTVLRATNNRQEPYVFSSLGADPFYFHPRPPNRPPELAAVTPLEVADAAGPTPLGMPEPIDPDQDPLTVRIVGMPRSGEVRIDGRLATVNTVVSSEQFKTATFKPDGNNLGSAGTLDILVEDGRGGSVTASLPITVRSSHHAPILGGPSHVEMAQQKLGIPAPVSPDGDTLTVTIRTLPRGTVRNGGAILHPGDQVTPQQLADLTYWPEAGLSGPAGSLRYSVDNGHGGIVDGSTAIDVGVSAAAAPPLAEVSLWEALRNSGDAAGLDAFLRLFPQSRFADEAKRRQRELLDAAGNSRVAATTPQAAAPQAATQAKPAADTVPSKPPDKPVAVAMAQPQSTPSDEPRPPASVMTAAIGPLVPAPSSAARGQSGDADRFQDCPSCPRMVRLTAGSFIMGMGAREPESMPAHRVSVRAFAIGAAPVTVREWKSCIAAKGCNFLPRMRVSEDLTPVHNLSWDDIGQYLTWLSNTTGNLYRLPSEAEWEYAARGGTATRYWWGDSAGMAMANCNDCGGTQDAHGPLPVDALPPNPFGLYDMLGGVAQWTADCWFPNYHAAPVDATPRDAKACGKRVLRGGSFRAGRDEITITSRSNYDAPVRYLVNGFRVARSIE